MCRTAYAVNTVFVSFFVRLAQSVGFKDFGMARDQNLNYLAFVFAKAFIVQVVDLLRGSVSHKSLAVKRSLLPPHGFAPRPLSTNLSSVQAKITCGFHQ
jgi:hypothetical protein